MREATARTQLRAPWQDAVAAYRQNDFRLRGTAAWEMMHAAYARVREYVDARSIALTTDIPGAPTGLMMRGACAGRRWAALIRYAFL